MLDQFIVETEQEQRKRLEDRIARRKQLIAERKAEGLSIDDATIDDIIEKEEEEETRKRRRVIVKICCCRFDIETILFVSHIVFMIYAEVFIAKYMKVTLVQNQCYVLWSNRKIYYG